MPCKLTQQYNLRGDTHRYTRGDTRIHDTSRTAHLSASNLACRTPVFMDVLPAILLAVGSFIAAQASSDASSVWYRGSIVTLMYNNVCPQRQVFTRVKQHLGGTQGSACQKPASQKSASQGSALGCVQGVCVPGVCVAGGGAELSKRFPKLTKRPTN